MKIEHVCINAIAIDSLKDFYVTYFGFKANAKYTNPKTKWCNYFLTSPDGGARLELLSHPDMAKQAKDRNASGWVHVSIALGSKEKVIAVTEALRKLGCQVVSEPRVTGDGYFESGVLDPEGNMLELTI
jgi:lactoylglutathione lyase